LNALRESVSNHDSRGIADHISGKRANETRA
jgi:hypothetical protein